MPMEKLRTGGTGPLRNSEFACRMVPSPPRVTIRSMGGEEEPVGGKHEIRTSLLVRGMEYHLASTDFLQGRRPLPLDTL